MNNIASNSDRNAVATTFTPLHYACQQFTSTRLNITQIHLSNLSFDLKPFKRPTISLHLTSHNITLLHCTLRRFFQTSIHFSSPCL